MQSTKKNDESHFHIAVCTIMHFRSSPPSYSNSCAAVLSSLERSTSFQSSPTRREAPRRAYALAFTDEGRGWLVAATNQKRQHTSSADNSHLHLASRLLYYRKQTWNKLHQLKVARNHEGSLSVDKVDNPEHVPRAFSSYCSHWIVQIQCLVCYIID